MTFWDRWARAYDWTQRTNRRVNAAAAARAAALVPPGARVLDCAAGTGLFSLAVSGRAGQVLCTDLSRPMLDQARKRRPGGASPTSSLPGGTCWLCRRQTALLTL